MSQTAKKHKTVWVRSMHVASANDHAADDEGRDFDSTVAKSTKQQGAFPVVPMIEIVDDNSEFDHDEIYKDDDEEEKESEDIINELISHKADSPMPKFSRSFIKSDEYDDILDDSLPRKRKLSHHKLQRNPVGLQRQQSNFIEENIEKIHEIQVSKSKYFSNESASDLNLLHQRASARQRHGDVANNNRFLKKKKKKKKKTCTERGV